MVIKQSFVLAVWKGEKPWFIRAVAHRQKYLLQNKSKDMQRHCSESRLTSVKPDLRFPPTCVDSGSLPASHCSHRYICHVSREAKTRKESDAIQRKIYVNSYQFIEKVTGDWRLEQVQTKWLLLLAGWTGRMNNLTQSANKPTACFSLIGNEAGHWRDAPHEAGLSYSFTVCRGDKTTREVIWWALLTAAPLTSATSVKQQPPWLSFSSNPLLIVWWAVSYWNMSKYFSVSITSTSQETFKTDFQFPPLSHWQNILGQFCFAARGNSSEQISSACLRKTTQ